MDGRCRAATGVAMVVLLVGPTAGSLRPADTPRSVVGAGAVAAGVVPAAVAGSSATPVSLAVALLAPAGLLASAGSVAPVAPVGGVATAGPAGTTGALPMGFTTSPPDSRAVAAALAQNSKPAPPHPVLRRAAGLPRRRLPIVNTPRRGKPVQVAYYLRAGDDYLGATRPAGGGAELGWLPYIPPVPSTSPPGSDVFEAPPAPCPWC